MKIFLDANVLVAVLNKEYPLFSYAARIMSLANNKKFTVYTSPICLANAFYFAEKKVAQRWQSKKLIYWLKIYGLQKWMKKKYRLLLPIKK